MIAIRKCPPFCQCSYHVPRQIKRSELNRLVRYSPELVPASIRATPRLSLQWTGKGWTRVRSDDSDFIVTEG